MMTALCDGDRPAAASARSSAGSDSPPNPSPPIVRKFRRETPSQNRLVASPWIVSIGRPAVSRPWPAQPDASQTVSQATHHEAPGDPWMPRPATPPVGTIAHSGPWTPGAFESVQVNVDDFGNNITGDAANEPSTDI